MSVQSGSVSRFFEKPSMTLLLRNGEITNSLWNVSVRLSTAGVPMPQGMKSKPSNSRPKLRHLTLITSSESLESCLRLAKFPHLLVGSSSGSGKSVLLQCLICCIIAFQPVQRVNLILFDINSSDLTVFSGAPHLSHPVVKDIETAVKVILALEAEMNRRHNEHDDWPYIVCISDEYSSLVTNIEDKKVREKVINAISKLLRMGRRAKIIWVLAAQDPTKDNMKVELANITARIAFKCAKYHNSVTILGEAGAEELTDSGTMLFKSPEFPNPMRLQGAYPEPKGIKELLSYLFTKPFDTTGKFEIRESEISGSSWDEDMVLGDRPPARQEQYIKEKELCDIIKWAVGQEQISAVKIMKFFHMSGRANDVINRLTELGIISEQFAKQPRQVLYTSLEDLPIGVKTLLTQNGIPIPAIDEVDRENLEPKELDHDK